MYQHPIPQNITTYQFRLIGDMTLKQFLELCIGVGLAIAINATNLFTPIKFILITFSVVAGFALAFMPIEERPLDQWILAFLKSIYSPTHYTWFKQSVLPVYFSYTPSSSAHVTDSEEMINAAILRKREGLSTFLQTLSPNQSLSKLETFEAAQLDSVTKLFDNSSLNPPSSPPSLSPAPAPYSQLNIDATTLKTPPSTTVTNAKPATAPATPPREVIVAPTPLIRVAATANSPQPATTQSSADNQAAPQPEAKSNQVAKKVADTTIKATTSTSLPFPSTPTTPNTIVGMVLDPQEKIIDNAIIEIRDNNGIPVRATKSNRLGQFFSTTPLKNGTYELEVEKEGFHFAIIKLELSGKILPPLKIQAN